MDSEDGKVFIKHLAYYVRTHEKALANALQLQRRSLPARPNVVGAAPSHSPAPATQYGSSPSSTLAAAFSLPTLAFTSQSVKPVKLSLTPHHLFYLLTRFEELNIGVGPMNVRLENIHSQDSPANYVSFLRDSTRRSRHDSTDSMSVHSVSSVRSVMSGMSSLWNTFGIGGGSSTSKSEKSKAALDADLKYLYSAFTKIPCLKLAPDRKAKLVEGFEEFPFDTAVPLLCFKNVSALEITDIDIRQFFGWDQMAERLRSLSVRRGGIEDVADLIISIVLDDMDKRRRRSSKAQSSPIVSQATNSPGGYQERSGSNSAPPSPKVDSAPLDLVGSAPASHPMSRGPSGSSHGSRPRSSSPVRPSSSRTGTSASHHRSSRMRRSGSGSSHSSSTSTVLPHQGSSTNLSTGTLPSIKWRFLRHLSLADNALTTISTSALAPLAGSLTSLDLSTNLFTAIPDAISILSNLRALNISNNMIDSLHSLTRTPFPAISALNLRANRLTSLAGVERLPSLDRIDLRNNKLVDPTELARLTGAPNMSEVWIAHNPFMKSHPNYRITIFNLFRNTPGYADDITIDGSAPGMVERRSLTDRVAELPKPTASAPISTPTLASTKIAPLDVKKSEDPQLVKRESEKSVHLVTSGQVAKAKKRSGRRRVVELTRDEPSPYEDSLSPITPSPIAQVSSSTRSMPSTEPDGASQRVAARGDETQNYVLRGAPLQSEQINWEVRGDEYKKRIEALKNEVGSGWLTVLSEEGWDAQASHPRHYSTETITPPKQVQASMT